jgi:hypothetical protein
MPTATSSTYLLDKLGTLLLREVIIRLLFQSIKEIAAGAKFLNDADFVKTFVDSFNSYNVRVVELSMVE